MTTFGRIFQHFEKAVASRKYIQIQNLLIEPYGYYQNRICIEPEMSPDNILHLFVAGEAITEQSDPGTTLYNTNIMQSHCSGVNYNNPA